MPNKIAFGAGVYGPRAFGAGVYGSRDIHREIFL
jgi:hypothetical protein